MEPLSKVLRICAIVLGVTLGLGAAIGAGVAWRLSHSERRLPDAAGLVERVREVARLQTLEVEVRELVAWHADPEPAETLFGDVANWVVHAVRPREGRAWVAATALVGLDLRQLDANAIRIEGSAVQVVLPPLHTEVLLEPDALQVVSSNLDSAQTAQLLDLGARTIRMNVERDAGLQGRARASAEEAIRNLLKSLGFSAVTFVGALPSATPAA